MCAPYLFLFDIFVGRCTAGPASKTNVALLLHVTGLMQGK